MKFILLLFCNCIVFFFFFFFFQAEDGIRDWSVTGVQTCALPICGSWSFYETPGDGSSPSGMPKRSATCLQHLNRNHNMRSEERRVGKECRYRWWRYH